MFKNLQKIGTLSDLLKKLFISCYYILICTKKPINSDISTKRNYFCGQYLTRHYLKRLNLKKFIKP